MTVLARPLLASDRARWAVLSPATGWAVALLFVVIAIGQQAALGLDGDVSWLLSVGERVLGGARLGREVVEVNPPASVLLYLPAIVASRATGWRVEAVVVAGVVVLAGVAVPAAGWLARSGERGRAVVAASAAFVFLVLPGACFAQREHVAVLLALPMLAVIARRAAMTETSRPVALLAGVAGGVAVAIKPHFALALLLPLAVAAARRRSIKAVLGPEWLCVVAVVALYGGVVLLAFPDYLAMLPLLRAVYLPLRADPVTLLRGPVVALPLALGALAWWVRGRQLGTQAATLGAAGLGFAVAGAVQGKGYLNHAYPAAALGLLMLAMILSGPGPFRRNRGVAVAGALLLAGLEWHAFGSIAGHPGLVAAAARVAPVHPRVIALSTELGIGHPLVRALDGRWVGRSAALWASGGARVRLAAEELSAGDRARLTGIAAADEVAFADAVRRGRPDLVLVDDTLPGWRHRPVLAGAMRAYRPAARVGDVALWTRSTRR